MANISIRDTATINLTDDGDVLEADVKISATAGNVLSANADGLFVANTDTRLTFVNVTDADPTDGFKTYNWNVIDADGNVIGTEAINVPDSTELPDAETTYSMSAPDALGNVVLTGTDEAGAATTQTVPFVSKGFANLLLTAMLDGVDANDPVCIATFDRFCEALPTKLTEV